MGGKSKAPVNQSNPSTTNTDRRLAVSSGAGVTGDNSSATSIDTQIYEFTSSYDFSDRSTDIDASSRNYDLSNRSVDASNRSDNSIRVDNSNSSESIRYMASQGSDTVQALADAGLGVIKSSGGAIIELAQFQGEKNTEAFNSLVTRGTGLIEKMLDKSTEGFGLAAKVVDSFTPTPNKEADNGKYMWMAAAAAAAVVLFKGK